MSRLRSVRGSYRADCPTEETPAGSETPAGAGNIVAGAGEDEDKAVPDEDAMDDVSAGAFARLRLAVLL